jgi:hypothetical protein
VLRAARMTWAFAPGAAACYPSECEQDVVHTWCLAWTTLCLPADGPCRVSTEEASARPWREHAASQKWHVCIVGVTRGAL